MTRVDSYMMNQLARHFQAGLFLHALLANSGIEAQLSSYIDHDHGVIMISCDLSGPAMVKLLRTLGIGHRLEYFDDQTRAMVWTYEVMVRNFPIALIATEHKYLRAAGASAYETEARRAA
jgi:hypothetical protein